MLHILTIKLIVYGGLNPHFTTTLVVTLCDSNACSVLVLQLCLRTTQVCVGPHLREQMNAKDADMENVPFVLVK